MTAWEQWQEYIRLTVLDQAEQRDAIRGWLAFMRATSNDRGTIAYLESWLVTGRDLPRAAGGVESDGTDNDGALPHARSRQWKSVHPHESG